MTQIQQQPGTAVAIDRTEARLAAELAAHKRQIAEARSRIERTLEWAGGLL